MTGINVTSTIADLGQFMAFALTPVPWERLLWLKPRPPFDARIGLAKPKLHRHAGILHAEPRVFVCQLNVIADTEIDVHVRRV